MFCSNCGNQLEEGSRFCPNCGASQVEDNFQQTRQQPQQQTYQQAPNQQMMNQQMQRQPMQPGGPKKGMSTGMLVGIICGSVALVALIVVLLLVFLGKDKDDDKKSKNDKTEKATEATTFDDSTTATTEWTETTTTTTEAATEAVPADDVNAEMKEKANNAYLDILNEHTGSIQNYTWQRGYNAGYSTPVSLYDLNDDGLDELIFMEAANDYAANLYIYTYKDGSATQVFKYENIDAEVAGGSVFYVAKIKDEKELLLYTCTMDEGYTEYFQDITTDGSGNYALNETYTLDSWPNDDYTSTIVTYKKNDVEVDKNTFDSFLNNKEGNIDAFLLYSDGEDIANLVSRKTDACLSLDSAKTKLGGSAGTGGSSVDSLPIASSVSLTFASGAGAWSTELTLNPDGSFTGLYHDSDMGCTGDGYPNGTCYYCDFSGKFKNIQKVDDYTYKMELDYYDTKYQVGTNEIYQEILYEYTDPYGIAGGTTFYYYLEGKPTSQLPEAYKSWAYGVIGTLDGKRELPCDGLYNEAEGEGFFAYTY